MDIIHIKNLEVFANHGVFEEENRLGQKFIISADLSTDLGIPLDIVYSQRTFSKPVTHLKTLILPLTMEWHLKKLQNF